MNKQDCLRDNLNPMNIENPLWCVVLMGNVEDIILLFTCRFGFFHTFNRKFI